MEEVESGQFSRAYTAILISYGCPSLLLARGLKTVISDLEREVQANVLFNVYTHLIFGIAAILIGLLRFLRGPASLPASNALSIALIVEFPIGTALFAYWLARVRARERPLQSGPESVRWYTTGLFIAALGVLLSAAVLRLGPLSGGSNEIFEILTRAYILVSAVLAMVGTVRCIDPRWGYYATFGLSIVLAPLVPVGTIASVLWFRKVRKDDQERR